MPVGPAPAAPARVGPLPPGVSALVWDAGAGAVLWGGGRGLRSLVPGAEAQEVECFDGDVVQVVWAGGTAVARTDDGVAHVRRAAGPDRLTPAAGLAFLDVDLSPAGDAVLTVDDGGIVARWRP